jgi:hypothetical protein
VIVETKSNGRVLCILAGADLAATPKLFLVLHLMAKYQSLNLKVGQWVARQVKVFALNVAGDIEMRSSSKSAIASINPNSDTLSWPE